MSHVKPLIKAHKATVCMRSSMVNAQQYAIIQACWRIHCLYNRAPLQLPRRHPAFRYFYTYTHLDNYWVMAIENEASAPPYHTAKQIPFELIQHSGIFFEEKLCANCLAHPERATEKTPS